MNEDFAVVVGINKYPGLNNLEGACKDALQVRDWLLAPDCGDVPEENIHISLTTHFHPPGPTDVNDVHPVEDEINSLFRPFVSHGALEGRMGRRLYIFMAGHGLGDPGDMDSAALYAANAEMMFAPHISGTAYANWFRRNAVFDEIVLIMDCCRTVTPMQSIRQPPLPNIHQHGGAANVRTFYAYGSSWGAAARERRVDGTVSGIFTTAFLEAVRIARPNNRGRVTGQIVKDYVHNIIARVGGHTQLSPPDIRVDTNRDITFVSRQEVLKFKVRVTFDPPLIDELLIVLNGRGKESVLSDGRNEHVDLYLEPDLYKASIQGTGRKKLFEVVGENVEITL